MESTKTRQPPAHEIAQERLFQLTMHQKWSQVADVYSNHDRLMTWKPYTAKLTNAEETALHVAISSYRSDHPAHTTLYASIQRMINSIPAADLINTLLMENDRGNTALHLATAVGWRNLCRFIASKDRCLMEARNGRKETPLFVAALYGNIKAFACLHEIYKKNVTDEQQYYELCRRDDGTTILHVAIAEEHFELAYQIIKEYEKLINSVNEAGESPLYVLAMKPNVFKSSTYLGLLDSLIYYCMVVDDLKKLKSDHGEENDGNSQGINYPENYRTCVRILDLLWRPIIESFKAPSRKSTGNTKDEENQQTGQRKSKGGRSQDQEEDDDRYYPPNYATCILLSKLGIKVILTVLGFGFNKIKKIRDKKRRHEHAFKIMNLLIEYESSKSYKYNDDGQEPGKENKPQLPEITFELPDLPPLTEYPDRESSTLLSDTCYEDYQVNEGQYNNQNKQFSGDAMGDQGFDNKKSKPVKKETSMLTAAKMGIPEMVHKIHEKFPIAIYDLDSNGKNVLLLAAENRHANVFECLLGLKLPEYLFHQVDNNENSILHLAAKLGELHPWRIPGAALQMQWEIKWYKYVKRKIPRLSYAHSNKDGETARKIFTKTHETLVEKGTSWMIKTSESCSVVAALIATVAFATSATVPGGLNQNSGYPLMENHTAFDIFSISSLVALCLSVTALVFFLAIITSRCQERDFKSNLPTKLLMGLTALFASITAMLVSFCAGHTFILRQDIRIAAVPIYTIVCLPVTLFVLAQLPLYFDLLLANCTEVPLRSYKVYNH